jgi:hypothetical protein
VKGFDANPNWPKGYFEVLEELRVLSKYQTFYAQWVRLFFNRILGKKRRRDLGAVEIRTFLAALKSEGRATDWQVEQARDEKSRQGGGSDAAHNAAYVEAFVCHACA